ncbi:MAG: hypothetical protein BGO70_08390 [Bacteroidetes bacterium 43-93]|nr:beta-ketoacyl synthase chain length factor [Bacteroidota bacterium]OJW97783.1 MAG: hypothetical protein BGO70_08390 [Bacteroidetes bacterium 43-93]
MMNLYLYSAGIISPAGSNKDADFPVIPTADKGRLFCKEPDYTGLIPPMQLRRMSKVVRTGIAASKISLQKAGIEKPDAISIGTAMGCLQDTEVFLTKMVEQDEQMLTPTAFIQSTHNTVSGQIALLCGCNGHNLTFVQRGHSFEHALINAELYLQDHPGESMLVGGIDELTDNSFKALSKAGIYSNDTIAGEGAGFFIASDQPNTGKNILVNDLLCFTAKNIEEALKKVEGFISCHSSTVAIDTLIAGRNGDKAMDIFYDRVSTIIAPANEISFKDKCGEYPTASAFAIGLLLSKAADDNAMKHVVMVNHFKHYYSCWLLQVI